MPCLVETINEVNVSAVTALMRARVCRDASDFAWWTGLMDGAGGG
jgi:hypothetical protein